MDYKYEEWYSVPQYKVEKLKGEKFYKKVRSECMKLYVRDKEKFDELLAKQNEL